MKISMLPATLFLASLLLTPLCAQENEEKLDCSQLYDQCGTVCDKLDEGYSECIDKCDLEYDKCDEQEEKASK